MHLGNIYGVHLDVDSSTCGALSTAVYMEPRWTEPLCCTGVLSSILQEVLRLLQLISAQPWEAAAISHPSPCTQAAVAVLGPQWSYAPVVPKAPVMQRFAHLNAAQHEGCLRCVLTSFPSHILQCCQKLRKRGFLQRGLILFSPGMAGILWELSPRHRRFIKVTWMSVWLQSQCFKAPEHHF